MLALPSTAQPITIRPGVMSDIPFLDSLQRIHTKQVGWMPTKQFEGKIKLGHVLIAEAMNVDCGLSNVEAASGTTSFLQSTIDPPQSPTPVGYLIGNDQYFKRDDVGVIYQLNVLPGKQRGFIGASLLKAQFERSAYGCRLYCCWCAQDIAANRFWEAMGFVPLAYRAGSESKSRVHIFWQKRIIAGDTTTPWWFPSKTAGGSIREDRIVLPIPPGTHWSDAKPLVLPGDSVGHAVPSNVDRGLSIVGKKKPQVSKRQSTIDHPQSLPVIRRNGLMFDIPQPGEVLAESKPEKQPKPKPEKIKRVADPRLVSAARELRDRWLEQVNADPSLLQAAGKYDVNRLPAPPATALPNLLAA